MNGIGIIGAGAFGTALGVTWARAGRKVTIWTRDQGRAEAMQSERVNSARLAGVTLPEGLSVTSDLAGLGDVQALVLAVPAQETRGFLRQSGAVLARVPLVLAAKGISADTHALQSGIVAEVLPDRATAILTGPGFASELALGLPTALTLATGDDALGAELQVLMSTPALRLYRSTDVIGAQLGGALKNVVAIACGMAIGAGLGESARAALMTRGFAEMVRLGQRMGAQPETFTGLSGLGDLALTCGSAQSRNFASGLALGRAGQVAPGVTVEGIATARATTELATRLGVDMPIARAVADVLDGKSSLKAAMTELLARPLTTETRS